MNTELLFVAAIFLLIASIVGLYEITKLKAYLKDEKHHANSIAYKLSEMEAAFRDVQHLLIRTTMEKEEVVNRFEEFVDIAIDTELRRLSTLYYSERLDQVIEFRELVQVGEL
mgnify:CR=1 FL=1|jgi:hypothetical protein|tara:strand:- start:13 stop:351 length:339 start_codon:yes stop_codon:yes gene_type:complete